MSAQNKINYAIRKSRIADMADVMKAHKLSIEQVCAKDYSSEQVSKWANINYSEDIWKKSVTEELHYVIEINNKIEGFCHSAVHQNGEGEIKGLYFTKLAVGKGIGKEAFNLAMNHLIERKCPRVFITATKTAKGFYEKMGFTVTEPSNISIRGITLECYNMEKLI